MGHPDFDAPLQKGPNAIKLADSRRGVAYFSFRRLPGTSGGIRELLLGPEETSPLGHPDFDFPIPKAPKASKLADSRRAVFHFSFRWLPGDSGSCFWSPRGRRHWAIRTSTPPPSNGPKASKLADSSRAVADFSLRRLPDAPASLFWSP